MSPTPLNAPPRVWFNPRTGEVVLQTTSTVVVPEGFVERPFESLFELMDEAIGLIVEYNSAAMPRRPSRKKGA